KPNHIIFSGPQEFSGNTIHFDLQNFTPPSSSFTSGDDFKMKSNCSKGKAKIKGEGPYSPQIGATASGTGAGNGSMGGRPYAFRFSANQVIGNQSFYPIAYFSYDGDGAWAPGQRGFLALRIIIDCNAYYGWADVTLNNVDCD